MYTAYLADYLAPAGGGNVTVALTGQSITSQQGTLTVADGETALGQYATFSAGTLSPGTAIALSGQAITSAQGSVSPATDVSASGQAATFAQGSLTVVGDITVPLNGQSMTAYQGSVTAPSSGVGGYGGKRRYVVRVKGRFLVFTDEATAIEALERGQEAKKVSQPPQPQHKDEPKAPAETPRAPEPEAVVSLAEIKKQAMQADMLAQYQRMLRAQEYMALVALFERLREEEEDELLLMAA